MIEAIIRWSVNNRLMVLLVTIMLAGAGLWSVKNTPVDAIPDLSDVQVIIKTSYPGQSPEVVENQVTYPLSTAMMSVPGATTVRGYSFFGDSYVYVIFDDDTDMYWARSRVLEYLSQIAPQLPEQATPQLGPDATGVGWVYIYALTDPTGNLDLSELRTLQDWFLKYELQSVEGVSEVASLGGMVRQYQIVVDPEALRAFDLPLAHIRNAVKRANQESGASVIEMAEAEYMIRATGYLESREDIEQIPLGLSEFGTPLLLKDVARVEVGPQMRRGIAELNGKGEVVGGIVVMRYGENAANTINSVKARLEELTPGLPDGVEIIPVYDRSALIDRAVDNLWEKLAEEFIVVILVCLLFLFHIRSGFVALISLPVGILTAFLVMKLQGLNANIMSLGGIAIAIGAMIDGAIVMIENMHKHMERTKVTNDNRWQIVIRSASEVGPALFFSLLIITISFIPVFTLEAQEGRMFAPLAFTKTYAMAASAALAITLVPVLMGYFVRGNIRSESSNPVNRVLVGLYQPLLKGVLRYPVAVIVAALILVLLTLWPAQKLGSEFMPELDEGDLMYMPTTYAGLSVGKARELLQQTDKLIATVPEVKSVFGKVGRADTATDPAPLTMIETFIQLHPKSEWRDGMTTDKLKAELDALVKFPGLTNAWVMPIKTRIDMLSTGIKTPLGIKISGPDLDQIESLGRALEELLGDLKGTRSVYSERVSAGRYITIEPDRWAAARYGLNMADVHDIIASSVGGQTLATTVEGLERYPVNVRYPQSYRDSPEALEALPVVTESGVHIRLGDIAEVRVESGPPAIKSENGRPSGWTYIDVDDVDFATYIEQARDRLNSQLELPPGYSLTWAGQYEYMQRAKKKLTYIVPLTLALIVLLLAMNFRRFSDVAIIIASLPLALVGSVWLMYILGYHISVAAGVGFIALAGVATELSVIMLVFLNQCLEQKRQLAEQEGRKLSLEDLRQAVMEGGALRVRPKAMTAAAIIVGLLPVLVGTGTGSEIMSRIAAPMVGGMISALVLTLLVVPAVYYLVHKRHLY
ncbi:efflux RND transporter permease subunit [Thalassolituus sp. UBA3500]|uniref:efflux RND transporter permease subunit n=1 Tax=Thalassolituus sp. UBA3500 TaxID=1947664 RepID=UPI000C0E5F56|nr:efflux RND transporter permease subunit [Thalassolituus sp. UBA3500]MBN57930.1 CusA/CzcA family heavy metal efflux RND transporter [Oceanospirillaceae bacterium]|tara:strand:- start:2852 stop:5971 length:3120 start_codon:yes stop_codon:yes gene_type:complete